jgi:uncharacterized RmlC-like cupin family protein
MDRPQVITR